MIASHRRQLVVATTNQGKLAEFRLLLPTGIDTLTPADLPVTLPPETGDTFEENACLKALAAARQTGILAIADDSGLEVDALGGAPGVRSARYAGEPSSDEQNRAALLAALATVPMDRRAARFRCVVALATPAGVIASAEGSCEGSIALAPRGVLGFGYDPVFLLADGRTMAELPADEKNRISHRAIAYQRIAPSLLAAFGRSPSEEV